MLDHQSHRFVGSDNSNEGEEENVMLNEKARTLIRHWVVGVYLVAFLAVGLCWAVGEIAAARAFATGIIVTALILGPSLCVVPVFQRHAKDNNGGVVGAIVIFGHIYGPLVFYLGYAIIYPVMCRVIH